MRKAQKFMAAAITATMILVSTVPVFADDNSQNTPPAKTEQAKQRIQKEIFQIERAQQFQQYMGPIRQLQGQEKQLREQIRELRKQINQQVKADRQAKNYTALLAALNDMIPMQDDIASALQAAKTTKADWEQLKSDNQAKNTQAIGSDLQKIEGDIQNRISVYQKILADLQKINQDLGQANSSSSGTTTPDTATVNQ